MSAGSGSRRSGAPANRLQGADGSSAWRTTFSGQVRPCGSAARCWAEEKHVLFKTRFLRPGPPVRKALPGVGTVVAQHRLHAEEKQERPKTDPPRSGELGRFRRSRSPRDGAAMLRRGGAFSEPNGSARKLDPRAGTRALLALPLLRKDSPGRFQTRRAALNNR
jgi:hypothetical protein